MLDVGIDLLLGKRCVVPQPNSPGEKVFDFRLDEDAFVINEVFLCRNFVIFYSNGCLDH